MPITNNTCVCGKKVALPSGSFDVKCESCGRVYNQHGVFLWRESPGPMTGVNIGKGEDDRRSPDQIAAAEAALEAGKALPEEPRREGDKADPDITPVAPQENVTTEGSSAELAKQEGSSTGNGEVVPGAKAPADFGDPSASKRGEHTHKHAKGEGHKPFTRSSRR